MIDGGKEDENLGSFYMGRMRKPPQPRRKLPPGTLTIVVVVIFAAIIWYAYPRGAEKYNDMDVPVVKADISEIKAVPVDPGGMEVRHQDSTVFDPMEQKYSSEPETIMPVPEAPMEKPQAVSAPAEEITQPLNVPMAAEPVSVPQTTEVKEVAETAVTESADISVKEEEIKKLFDIPAPEVKKIEEPEKVVKAPVVELPAETPKVEEKKIVTPPKKEVKKVEKKPPVVAEGNSLIQLGAFREAAAAQKDWARLKGKYPQYLGKLVMKTEQVYLPGKGVYYRLQAGKLSEARAREICTVIKSANAGGCILVK